MNIYNVLSAKLLPSFFVNPQFLFANIKSRLFTLSKLFALFPSIFGSSPPFLVSFPMPPAFLFFVSFSCVFADDFSFSRG